MRQHTSLLYETLGQNVITVSELCLLQGIGPTTIIDQLPSCELPPSYHLSIDKVMLVMNHMLGQLCMDTYELDRFIKSKSCMIECESEPVSSLQHLQVKTLLFQQRLCQNPLPRQ